MPNDWRLQVIAEIGWRIYIHIYEIFSILQSIYSPIHHLGRMKPCGPIVNNTLCKMGFPVYSLA